MARLGDLERAVMDVLWDSDVWVTAREVGRKLHHDKRLAYTTVLTVLDRLERKGFVLRERAGRAHRYRAADSRETVVAVAMLEALDTADDRDSALVRFVGGVSPEEAEVLRRALATADPAEGDQEAAGLGSDPAGLAAGPLVPGIGPATPPTGDSDAGLTAPAPGTDQAPHTGTDAHTDAHTDADAGAALHRGSATA
jgi:predicted transcriptional regulator